MVKDYGIDLAGVINAAAGSCSRAPLLETGWAGSFSQLQAQIPMSIGKAWTCMNNF